MPVLVRHKVTVAEAPASETTAGGAHPQGAGVRRGGEGKDENPLVGVVATVPPKLVSVSPLSVQVAKKAL
jgi:hypothetical protein